MQGIRSYIDYMALIKNKGAHAWIKYVPPNWLLCSGGDALQIASAFMITLVDTLTSITTGSLRHMQRICWFSLSRNDQPFSNTRAPKYHFFFFKETNLVLYICKILLPFLFVGLFFYFWRFQIIIYFFIKKKLK